MKSETSTIYHVAEEAGTSITTVSRVINAPDKVSSKTREKVHSAMEKLGFVPKAEARERARKSIGRIAVFTPDISYPSFTHRLRGIASRLKKDSCELVILSLESQEEIQNYLKSPDLSHKIDGLIVISHQFSEPTLKILNNIEIPVIFVEFGEEGYSGVCIDNYKGGQLATQFLIDKGFQNIAVFSEEEKDQNKHPNRLRVQGCLHVLEERGLPGFIKTVQRGSLDLAENTSIAKVLLKECKPQAVFATTDFLAVAMVRAANQLKVRVPEDLSIIGFDGTITAQYMDITTIDQSLEESGYLAADLVLKKIKEPQSGDQSIYLPLKIVERNTTS